MAQGVVVADAACRLAREMETAAADEPPVTQTTHDSESTIATGKKHFQQSIHRESSAWQKLSSNISAP